MKQNRYTTLTLLLLLLLSACKSEVENCFPNSASERLENEIVRYQDLLTKPQHGWVMEYYPGGTTQAWGGFALTVSFTKEGEATFHSILSENLSESDTSPYELGKDVGPTLNFNVYNKLLSYFSDPDKNEGDGKGAGYLGDYEFVLKQGSADSVIMTGKKHNSVIRLYPLTEPAEKYLEKARTIRDSFVKIPGILSLSGTWAGEPIVGELVTPQRLLLTQGKEQTYVSFMFTDKGVKLYKPIELSGKTVSALEWNPTEQTFTSPDGIAQLKLDLTPNALPEEELLGDYVLSYGVRNRSKSNVTIAKKNGAIVMTGLPFDIYLLYNTKKGALELLTQSIGPKSENNYLAIWDTSVGSLSWMSGLGLVTEWNGNKEDFVLRLVPNDFAWMGKDGPLKGTGFIFWNSASGEVKVNPSRFSNPILTKKK